MFCFFQGIAVVLPWPWWCQCLAAVLILSSILWIPGVALVKYTDLIEWKMETPAFFPTEELKEERNIKKHETTKFEKYFLGFRD